MQIGIAPLILIVAAVAHASGVPIVIVAPVAAILMALAVYALNRAKRSLLVATNLAMITVAYYVMQTLLAAPTGSNTAELPAFVPQMMNAAPYVIVGMSIVMFVLEFLHGLYDTSHAPAKDHGGRQ